MSVESLNGVLLEDKYVTVAITAGYISKERYV
jgi:hypothetical protein